MGDDDESTTALQAALVALSRAAEEVMRGVRVANDDLLEVVRDVSLSLAVTDRALASFTATLLRAADSQHLATGLDDSRPLVDLVARLRGLPPPVLARVFPPGGIVSLLFHLADSLDTVADALADVGAKRPAVTLPRLSEAHSELLVLLRLWFVSSSVLRVSGPATALAAARTPTLRGIKSFTVLLSSADEREAWDEEAKPLARRLLETATLPASGALWPAQGPDFAAVKKGLDVYYAATWAGWRVSRAVCGPSPSPSPSALGPSSSPSAATAAFLLNVLSVVLYWAVTLLAAVFYTFFRPKAPAGITSRLMLDPSILFITRVWRVQDTPVLSAVALALAPPLPTSAEILIAGVPCRVLSNVALGDLGGVGGVRGAAWEGLRALVRGRTLGAEPPPPDHPLTEGGTGAAPPSPPFPPRALLTTPSLPVHLPPTLLVIPGGGFVGRSFAADIAVLSLNVSRVPPSTPIVAVYVRYSLAPERRHPVALNECADVYAVLRPRAPRLVLQGESAGGNLATALAIRILRGGGGGGGSNGGSRTPAPPTALALYYPALSLLPQASPSRALHLSDPLVPYHLLVALATICHENGRLEAGESTADVYRHPANATDADLAAFPPTRVSVGGLDPLLDESLDFVRRMQRAGAADVHLHVLRRLPHGFYNFAFPGAEEGRSAMWAWVRGHLGGEGGGGGGGGGVGGTADGGKA
jgi:acetyl esterase/lipase